MDATMLARAARQAFPGRNQLATAGDRLEGAVLVAAVCVALLAVPVAGAVGSEVYASQMVQSVSEQRTRQQVDAVLIEDAPPVNGFVDPDGPVESGPVRATWRGPDGKERQGTVQAAHGRKSGGVVPIWVDGDGALTRSPLTTEGAAIEAMALAVLLWAGTSAAMALSYLMVRFVRQRMRIRRWAAEWERIAADWTAR
ncbi:hypothetical protein OG205_09540 [Lentzea sp. NBC_00516]|uniref:Rv1733c family protein n=1 Tax=Lentzea sp. NBC_00516 TaxID=2903582 RepID=UPI002E80B993|nr:hypothetical protein [Lentzea sp. NBC_00516]WUD27217.1 hypothetical protein OG205_09540 [Lentzea sp. NBC_00516]